MNSFSKKLLTWFFVLLPITNIYGIGIPGFSIGKILLITIVILGMLNKDIRINILSLPKAYIVYFAFMFTIPQLLVIVISPSNFSFSGSIYKSIGVIGFFVTYAVCYNNIDINYLIKTYRKIVFVCCCFFLFQELIFFLTSINIPGIIRGAVLADSSDINRIYLVHLSEIRHSSFFLEPAHLAQYISSYIFIYLFYPIVNKRIISKEFLFITIIVILLKSGNALFIYALAMACWSIAMVYRRKRFIIILIAILTFFPFIIQKISNSGNTEVQKLWDRRKELIQESNENTSGFQRIYRGYILYDELTTSEKVFGIGLGNLDKYIETHSLKRYKTASNYTLLTYLNGIQYILVHGGILSLLLYLSFLLNLAINNQITGKLIILLLLLLSLISSNYNAPDMLIITVLASLLKRQFQEKITDKLQTKIA